MDEDVDGYFVDEARTHLHWDSPTLGNYQSKPNLNSPTLGLTYTGKLPIKT